MPGLARGEPHEMTILNWMAAPGCEEIFKSLVTSVLCTDEPAMYQAGDDEEQYVDWLFDSPIVLIQLAREAAIAADELLNAS